MLLAFVACTIIGALTLVGTRRRPTLVRVLIACGVAVALAVVVVIQVVLIGDRPREGSTAVELVKSIGALSRVMLFGGEVLLTPTPVNLGSESLRIAPSKPLTAVTEGAYLMVSLNNQIDSSLDLIQRMKLTDEKFARGCGTAILVATDGRETTLTSGGAAVTNTDTFLLLTAPGGVPTDRKFASIRLQFDCPVGGTRVYWHNFKM